MVRVPIFLENIDFVRMDLSRHYSVIDCDFTCYIVVNPTGTPPFAGTDIAVLNIGSWQIDTWTFLLKEKFPNNPGFVACLVWDKTLVQDTEQGRKAPRLYESDVDVSDSVSSLKGQPVNITGFSLEDGKSLKVSTLENEFCFVRPFPSSELITSDVVNVGSAVFSLALNDVLDIDSFYDYFKKRCSIVVSDDMSTIVMKVLDISFCGDVSANKSYFSFTKGSGMYSGPLSPNTDSKTGIAVGGCAGPVELTISLSDNVITGLNVKATVVWTGTVTPSSAIPLCATGSIDCNGSKVTLW